MGLVIIGLAGVILMGINIRNRKNLKEFKGTFVEKNSKFLFGLVLIISSILKYMDTRYDFNFWTASALLILMLTLAISLVEPLEKQRIYLKKYKK